ncbi:MAG: hypothetical protein WBE90_08190 [Xanthobacteraceae bacterium]
MLRGSRPGERRGGRKRDTPNRRTILTDRILSIGSEHPTASQCAFLLILVKDQKLPADTRMAVAPKCFPAKRTQPGGTRRPRVSADVWSSVKPGPRAKSVEGSKDAQTAASAPANQNWNPQVLDALLGIVQDVAADPRGRRKAALKIAEFLLPKIGKKAKAVPDEYGFAVNPQLARRYRDIRRELQSLEGGPTRKIPAVAQMIQKLKAQVDAIRQRLEVPCPTKYSRDQWHQDLLRLIEFLELRANNTALTDAQDAEEAHLRARFDVFAYSPENIACGRLNALRTAEQLYKKHLFWGDYSYAVSLSPKDERDLEFLRRLYWKAPQRPFSERGQSVYDDREELEAIHGSHPFWHELPAADGNLYPQDSKLRPRNAA